MKILDEPKAIRLKIMDFLSRREHSAKEIFQKMSPRVESKDMLLDSIDELLQDGLLSDERFAESYLQSRKIRGYGPVRIRNELISYKLPHLRLVVPSTMAILFPLKSPFPRMLEGASSASDNVNADARPAVIDETATRDITIQTPAMARPVLDSGARSPYPTVVNVTRPNHIPFPTPWRYWRGNCSVFLRRSASQIRFPKINRSEVRMPTDDKAAQPMNGRRRVINPGGF